jgi:hypothetical protein
MILLLFQARWSYTRMMDQGLSPESYLSLGDDEDFYEDCKRNVFSNSKVRLFVLLHVQFIATLRVYRGVKY